MKSLVSKANRQQGKACRASCSCTSPSLHEQLFHHAGGKEEGQKGGGGKKGGGGGEAGMVGLCAPASALVHACPIVQTYMPVSSRMQFDSRTQGCTSELPVSRAC